MKVKVETRVLTKVVTKTDTVVKTVAPNIPAGAYLPSTQPPLTLASFVAPGANIGCSLAGGVARCDIQNRVWTPPAQPESCKLDWAQGLEVGGSGPGSFVCAGNTVLDGRTLVADGRDDTFGPFRCEIRQFGVACYDTADKHGFSISRTGYTTF